MTYYMIACSDMTYYMTAIILLYTSRYHHSSIYLDIYKHDPYYLEAQIVSGFHTPDRKSPFHGYHV